MRGLSSFQVWDWAASERRFMMMVPRSMASSMGKRVFPGTCTSKTADQLDSSSDQLRCNSIGAADVGRVVKQHLSRRPRWKSQLTAAVTCSTSSDRFD